MEHTCLDLWFCLRARFETLRRAGCDGKQLGGEGKEDGWVLSYKRGNDPFCWIHVQVCWLHIYFDCIFNPQEQQPSWLHTYIYIYHTPCCCGTYHLRSRCSTAHLLPLLCIPYDFPFSCRLYIYMPQHYNYALNSRTKTDWGWFHDSRWASKFAIISPIKNARC